MNFPKRLPDDNFATEKAMYCVGVPTNDITKTQKIFMVSIR